MSTDDLLRHRYLKFRKIGGFQEGIPIDPKRTVNMKKREAPIAKKISDAELEEEVEKLKQQILKAMETSSETSELGLNEMIQKLKKEVDQEYSLAVKALGLQDRFTELREEFTKVKSEDHLIHPALKDKIEKLEVEFKQGLPAAPNYGRLQNKLDMLKELSKVKFLSDGNKKAATLKQTLKAKFEGVINNPSFKEKYEALKAEVASSGVSSLSDLDDELKKKIFEFKNEAKSQLVDVLKSEGLEVKTVKAKARDSTEDFSEFKSNIEELNKEINEGIKTTINSSDLKSKIELLKIEVAMAGETPDLASKNRIAALEQQIKRSLTEALDNSSLKDKFENIKSKISTEVESTGKLDGSLKNEDSVEENPASDESRMKVERNRTFV